MIFFPSFFIPLPRSPHPNPPPGSLNHGLQTDYLSIGLPLDARPLDIGDLDTHQQHRIHRTEPLNADHSPVTVFATERVSLSSGRPPGRTAVLLPCLLNLCIILADLLELETSNQSD